VNRVSIQTACFTLLIGCGDAPVKDKDRPTDTVLTEESGSFIDTGPTTSSPTPETGDTATTLVPVQVEESGVVSCENPALREAARFERRLDADVDNSFNWIHGAGIMVADLNADGDQDILAPTELGVRYYQGQPDGTFLTVEAWAFDDADMTFGNGGAVADYDGDGDLDVYLLRYMAPNLLLSNNGDGSFTTMNSGVGSGEDAVCPGCPDGMGGSDIPPSTSAAWADWDHDGDLDLYVGNYGVPDQTGKIPTAKFEPAFQSYLYKNRGDGTFEDVSSLLPDTLHHGYTYAGGWHDIDDDGWLDLIVVNDFGPAYPNVVMRNDRGSLVEGWRDHLWIQTTGMGLGVADLNEDGYLDLLIPEYDKMSFWRSSAQSKGEVWWLDVALSLGMRVDRTRDQMVGWGAEIADIDNDADLDAVVAYGYIGTVHPNWHNPAEQPDALYLQDADGQFDDVAPDWGMDDMTSGRGFQLADINHDGYLDLVKRDLEGPNVIWSSNCGTNAWMMIRPRQREGGNQHAVGARVWVTVGARRIAGDIRAGGTSFASSGPPEVHFGLGEYEEVDGVTIRWPDGELSELGPLSTRQLITVTRL